MGKWKQLTTPSGPQKLSQLDTLLSRGNTTKLARLLSDLPHADEVSGFLDLRGAPIVWYTPKDGATWPALDMSYAQTTRKEASSWGVRFLGPFGILGVRLAHSRLVRVTLSLFESVFEGCDLNGTKIDGHALLCQFVDCELSQTKLPVEFRDSRFVRCTFAGADLRKTVFQDCELTACDFRAAKFSVRTRFKNVRFDAPPLFDPEELAEADLDRAPNLRALVGSAYVPAEDRW